MTIELVDDNPACSCHRFRGALLTMRPCEGDTVQLPESGRARIWYRSLAPVRPASSSAAITSVSNSSSPTSYD